MPTLPSTDKFVIRVIKSLATSPLNEWANSYEFGSDDPVSVADLSVLASTIVLFEKTIHSDTVAFKRCLVSTWEADSKPYNPATFLTIGLVGNGGVGPTVDPLALNQVFIVARNPETGRLGHLFYRGVLWEENVEAPNGISVLSDPDAMDTLVQDALLSSGLDAYIGATVEAPLQMRMINKDGSQVRNVVGLAAAGVTTLPTDHAWFNRTTSP